MMPRQIAVHVEWIEVDTATCTALTERPNRSTDGSLLRAKLAELIGKGEARVAFSKKLVTRSGQRAQVDSGQEVIYPVEFFTPDPEKEEGPGLPVPTAFETRTVGATVEIDPVIGPDGVTVDLNAALELTWLVGETSAGQIKDGESEISLAQPLFYSTSTTTAVTMTTGVCVHVSTEIPPDAEGVADPEKRLILLVRSDVVITGMAPDPLPEPSSKKPASATNTPASNKKGRK